MVSIPAGSYLMGATDEELRVAGLPAYFAGREKPRREVAIEKPFTVARFEASIADYARFVAATGYALESGCWAHIGEEFVFEGDRRWDNSKLGQADDHPVTCISWVDAVANSAGRFPGTLQSIRSNS